MAPNGWICANRPEGVNFLQMSMTKTSFFPNIRIMAVRNSEEFQDIFLEEKSPQGDSKTAKLLHRDSMTEKRIHRLCSEFSPKPLKL